MKQTTMFESSFQNQLPKKCSTPTPQINGLSLESYGRIDKYKIIKEFGNRHLNRVFLVQTDVQKSKADLSPSLCVVKTMDLSDEAFSKETKILSLPPHPNIIACKEFLTSVAIEVDFDIRIQNAVVLEYAPNGDFYPYLECGPLPESICRFYFGQLIDAIDHVHANGYCHLDIKPENLLLDERFNFKLSDFGFAAPYEEKLGGRLVNSTCGTSSYFPPEVWKRNAVEEGYDGTKADVFQCGILLFIMITGQPPFTKCSTQDGWFSLIARKRWDEFWSYKEKRVAEALMAKDLQIFSPELRELLQKIFEPQSNKRITIEEIKKSAWFTQTYPAEPIELQLEMLTRKINRKIGQK